jgi:hypothetical protein
VRCFLYPLDQDHAHSTSIEKFLHQELVCSIHPPNKYSMCYVISLQVSLKKYKEDMVIPKKRKEMLRSMTQKKERRIKGIAMSKYIYIYIYNKGERGHTKEE